MTDSIKYLSICSGIESVGVAWNPLGFEPVGLSEIDPFRSAVLEYHYPEVKNYGDFTKIQKTDLRAQPDVLVGGTPCATFSIAGLREGISTERGNLALEFIKLAQRLQPTWVVWENVPGVLSSNGGRDFASFLGGLAECGYGFAYRVLNTEYVRTQRFPRAIPQRRRRVFVIGHLGDWRSAAKVLFDSASMPENPRPLRRKRSGASKKPETNTGEHSEDQTFWTKINRQGEYVDESAHRGVSSTLTAGGRHSAQQNAILVEHPTDVYMMRDSQTGSNGKPYIDEDVSWSLTAHDRYTVIETSTPDKTARIHKDEISPTLTAMTGGNRQPIVFIEKETTDTDNSLIHCADEVEIVKVRKHEVDVEGLQKVLKESKDNKNYTMQQIANMTGVNKTTVDHWFRTDNSFAIPTEDIWEDLKKVLGIETTKFDASITEFEYREGNYEMSKRVYSSDGVSPTITASNPDAKIQINPDGTNNVIRRLTPIECERLQGFPDNYTQIPYRGKPKEECPVSKRYEACGRAMSINVMEYMGDRLKKVHNGEI
jgi:DNA-cytosine methyltransferase